MEETYGSYNCATRAWRFHAYADLLATAPPRLHVAWPFRLYKPRDDFAATHFIGGRGRSVLPLTVNGRFDTLVRPIDREFAHLRSYPHSLSAAASRQLYSSLGFAR